MKLRIVFSLIQQSGRIYEISHKPFSVLLDICRHFPPYICFFQMNFIVKTEYFYVLRAKRVKSVISPLSLAKYKFFHLVILFFFTKNNTNSHKLHCHTRIESCGAFEYNTQRTSKHNTAFKPENVGILFIIFLSTLYIASFVI